MPVTSAFAVAKAQCIIRADVVTREGAINWDKIGISFSEAKKTTPMSKKSGV